MKLILCVMVIAAVIAVPAADSFAKSNSSNILRQGLLGAGAGAAGSAAGGGNAGTGALVGAGVNILGGALLDSIGDDGASGERQQAQYQQQQQQQTQYQPHPVQSRSAYSDGYDEGYRNGYKQGYTEGYREGTQQTFKKN
ncbi:MAG: hypothetical protein KJ995_00785 [Candidatus Omnitrophica bacterium]|nr:hypothetical protein [Candidatus Omnitrophota bacterium]MBU1850928.1 hypothetical protein [Candidatus Omnitrophota bacterium]